MTELFLLDELGRVVEPEGKTREFKRDLSSPTKPLRTIAAFANSAGGLLVIGVADDGAVIGIDDPLAEEEGLASLIADSISPQLVPAIDIATVAGRTVLIVDVPLSTRRPHYLTSQGLPDGVYVRIGSSTRQADPALVAELERTARGVAFEDLPEPRATLADLDLATLSAVRGRPTGDEDLIALGLAAKYSNKVVPTNAGILAACPDPARFLPSAWVQCGRLRGPKGTDIFDQIDVHGLMPLAVDRVLEFLLKHAYKTAVFGEVRRRDVYSIPIEPIREVVVNALVHANYAERGTPIRVAFYDDRIQVDSPGLLLPGMTVSSMHLASRLRNASLARIFREAGIMEQWGTGIARVYEQLAQAGLPEPRVEEVIDRVRFTIYLPAHAAGVMAADPNAAARLIDPAGLGESLGHQVESLSDRELTMLRLVRDQPASGAELLASIGIGNETRNLRRHVHPLLDAGLIARTVPQKPTSSRQRYRLTPAGCACLAANHAAVIR